MPAETAPASSDALEPIRRAKSAEDIAAARLAELEGRTKEELELLRRESDAAVGRARTEGEAARDELLGSSRIEADREAEAILAEGRAAAARIRPKGPAELEGEKEGILSAVLGDFRPPKR